MLTYRIFQFRPGSRTDERSARGRSTRWTSWTRTLTPSQPSRIRSRTLCSLRTLKPRKFEEVYPCQNYKGLLPLWKPLVKLQILLPLRIWGKLLVKTKELTVTPEILAKITELASSEIWRETFFQNQRASELWNLKRICSIFSAKLQSLWPLALSKNFLSKQQSLWLRRFEKKHFAKTTELATSDIERVSFCKHCYKRRNFSHR